MNYFQTGVVFIVLMGIAMSGHTETLERSVHLATPVTRVYLSVPAELHLRQGEEEYVKLTAPAEIMAQVDARLKGRSLYLGNERTWQDESSRAREFDGQIRFDVQLRRIDAVRVRGAGRAYIGDLVADSFKIIMYGSGKIIARSVIARDMRLEMSGSCTYEGERIDAQKFGIEVTGSGTVDITQLQTDEIVMDVDGSGRINLMDMNTRLLETEITDSADITLAGYAGHHDLEVNGSGNNYKTAKLISNSAYIEMRGGGDAEISVQELLTAEISRGADLKYYGGQALAVDISGQGKHRRVGAIPGN